MCKAWDEAMQDYKEEGKKEGKKEGIKEGIRAGQEEGIRGIVEILRGYGAPREKIVQEIQRRFSLSHKIAEEKYGKYNIIV